MRFLACLVACAMLAAGVAGVEVVPTCAKEKGFCSTKECPATAVEVFGLSGCPSRCCIPSTKPKLCTDSASDAWCGDPGLCTSMDGTVTHMKCPGSNAVKCCTNTKAGQCSFKGTAGKCQDSESACSGFRVKDGCPNSPTGGFCCVENRTCKRKEDGKQGVCMDTAANTCTDLGRFTSDDCPAGGDMRCCLPKPKCSSRYIGDVGLRVILNNQQQKDAFEALKKELQKLGITTVDDFSPSPSSQPLSPNLLPQVQQLLEGLKNGSPAAPTFLAEEFIANPSNAPNNVESETTPGFADLLVPSAVLQQAQDLLSSVNLNFLKSEDNPGQLIADEAQRIEERIAALRAASDTSNAASSAPPSALNPASAPTPAADPWAFCEPDTIGSNLFTEYWPLSCIERWLKGMEKKHSTLVKMKEIGKSFEKRSVFSFDINKGSEKKERRIAILGGNHSREWLAHHVVLFIINELLSKQSDPSISTMLDKIEWSFIPMMNPDGYEYTWPLANPSDCDRLWRKTRSKHTGMGSCIGVNANRNFDFKWCTGKHPAGGFKNSCDDNYCGPSATSETEVKAVVTHFNDAARAPMKLFVDFHTFGQTIVVPPASTTPDATAQASATLAATAMKTKHGSIYTPTPSSKDDIFGSSDDFFFSKGVKRSYTIELRPPMPSTVTFDNLFLGFLIHPNNTVPTGEEVMEGLKVFAAEIIV